MRVEAGLDHRTAAIEIDEQVMCMTGEQEFGGALVLELDRIAAIAVEHRADEIGALCEMLAWPQPFNLMIRSISILGFIGPLS